MKHFSKTFKSLDPFTFGDSKACQNLVDMLNKTKDIKLARQISKIINQYNTLVKQLDLLTDFRSRTFLLTLLNQELHRKSFENCPEIIKTHTFNVICRRIRQSQRNTAEYVINRKAEENMQRSFLKWLEENEDSLPE